MLTTVKMLKMTATHHVSSNAKIHENKTLENTAFQ
jgi:hypothetical protein